MGVIVIILVLIAVVAVFLIVGNLLGDDIPPKGNGRRPEIDTHRDDYEKALYQMNRKAPEKSINQVLRECQETVYESNKVINKSLRHIDTEIVGMEYRSDLAKEKMIEINPGDKVYLRREQNNQYDSNAVKVYFNNSFIGYIPRKFSYTVAQAIDFIMIEATMVDDNFSDEDCDLYSINVIIWFKDCFIFNKDIEKYVKIGYED